MPLGTALVIGVQGLLAGAAPQPPPIAPTAQHGLWSKQWRDRERVLIEVRGVRAMFSIANPHIAITAKVDVLGNDIVTKLKAPTASISAYLTARANIQNLSISRARQRISTAFVVVGCQEDDEAKIRTLAHAALEEYILQNIIDSYND
jgi:hypothetical protein